MNMISPAVAAAFAIFLNISCQNSNTELDQLRKEQVVMKRQIDSLEVVLQKRNKVTTEGADTVSSKQTDLQQAVEPYKPLRTGKHAFTLQWISWDEPGSVNIQPGQEGWYSIKGEQKSSRNDDFITIEGHIKPVSATELIFKGRIESVVESNNQGKPCIKEGSKIFKTTQNRKYWRLQDMINCEGGQLTDYVDIYF